MYVKENYHPKNTREGEETDPGISNSELMCSYSCAAALLWFSGSSWLHCMSVHFHVVSKQAVLTALAQHPALPIWGGRAASSSVTPWSISDSLAFTGTVLYRKKKTDPCLTVSDQSKGMVLS